MGFNGSVHGFPHRDVINSLLVTLNVRVTFIHEQVSSASKLMLYRYSHVERLRIFIGERGKNVARRRGILRRPRRAFDVDYVTGGRRLFVPVYDTRIQQRVSVIVVTVEFRGSHPYLSHLYAVCLTLCGVGSGGNGDGVGGS